MKHLYTHLVHLVLGLCCFSCCTDAAIIDNSFNNDRLPTSLKPLDYNLEINTNQYYGSGFHGAVTIRFLVLEDTTNITLHSQNLRIKKTKLMSEPGNETDCVVNVTQVLEHDFLIIHLNKTLHKEQVFMLYIEFHRELSENLYGYHVGSYLVKATNRTSWPNARAVFPCWDEPKYKTNFVIDVLHFENFTALSNMPLNMPFIGGDNIYSHFKNSVPMSTYMVAFTVNDLKSIISTLKSKTNNNTVFRTWARPEAINQCNYASKVGAIVLKFYEDIFGIKFALGKFDQIALPDFNGNAKENWGLVTFPESSLLFDPSLSSNTDKLRIAQIIAYILAQQWLGNLVTLKCRSDLWLYKGISTYVSSLGVERLIPKWKSYNEGSLENILYIFRKDAQLSSHSISQRMLSTSAIGEQYDTISSKKSSSLFRMLHSVLGKQAFFKGVKDFLKKHEYANAEPDDLWAVFTENTRLNNRTSQDYDIKTFMHSWTSQSGYPLVRVTRDYQNRSITISQHRFFENKTLTEQQLDKKECWWIPVSYTTSSKMNFQNITPQNWLECDTTGKSRNLILNNINAKWVLFNIQLSGVYRVLYDDKNWIELIGAIKGKNHKKFNIMNRVQLLDDSLSLAFGGYLRYQYPFNLLEYLLYEREYLPWKTAFEALSRLERLLQPISSNFGLYKRYIRYIMKPVYNYFNGVNATGFKESSSFTQTMLKSLIADWACRLEIGDCVKVSLSYFKKWKLSENAAINNTIPVDLRPTVYCAAISNGTEDDWQFLLRIYRESNVTTGKLNLVTSMACSRNTTTLRQYLDLIYDTPGFISKRDATSAFSSMARNEAGFPIAKEYFLRNIDKLSAYYGPDSNDLGNLLSSLAKQITSLEDRDEFISLIESKEDYFRNSETSVQNAIETVNSNLKFINLYVQDTNSNLQYCINSAQLFKEKDLL